MNRVGVLRWYICVFVTIFGIVRVCADTSPRLRPRCFRVHAQDPDFWRPVQICVVCVRRLVGVPGYTIALIAVRKKIGTYAETHDLQQKLLETNQYALAELERVWLLDQADMSLTRRIGLGSPGPHGQVFFATTCG